MSPLITHSLLGSLHESRILRNLIVNHLQVACSREGNFKSTNHNFRPSWSTNALLVKNALLDSNRRLVEAGNQQIHRTHGGEHDEGFLIEGFLRCRDTKTAVLGNSCELVKDKNGLGCATGITASLGQ
jgi:hypothetical protein